MEDELNQAPPLLTPWIPIEDDMMDVEPQQPSPLGDWNPRVVINRRAMEEALLQATTPQRIGNVEGPYSREPDRSRLQTDFGNETWEEIFPNNPPTKHPWQKDGTEINWDNWDLKSERPAAGSSARELITRLEKYPPRCWNPECCFFATGVFGSDFITRENRHHYWDPEWTRRTGIGTALPWCNAAKDRKKATVARSCNHGNQVPGDTPSSDQTMYDNNHDANAEIIVSSKANPRIDANNSSCSDRRDAAAADSQSTVDTETPVTPTKNSKKKGAATTKKSAMVRHDLESPQGDNVPSMKAKSSANVENSTPTGNSKMNKITTPTTVSPMKRKSSKNDLDARMKKMKMDGDGDGDPFW